LPADRLYSASGVSCPCAAVADTRERAAAGLARRRTGNPAADAWRARVFGVSPRA
jgi:hypothetical protein